MTPAEVASLIVAAATLLSSLAGLVVALRTGQKTSRTHDLVNGQAARLEAVERDKGVVQGRLEGTPGVMGKYPQSELGTSTHRPPSQ